jgi:hypothetical protein
MTQLIPSPLLLVLEFLSSVGGVFCPAEQACLGEASLPPQRQWSSAADGCDAVGGY